MRRLVPFGILFVLLLSACTEEREQSAVPPVDEQEVMETEREKPQSAMEKQERDEKETGTIEDAGGDGSVGKAMPKAPANPVSMETRRVRVVATNWAFTPSVITVKKGQKLTLDVFAEEGTHGYAVPDLGINASVQMGKTVVVEIPTDRVGNFPVRCSILCGSGHGDMIGSIIIED